MYNYDLNYVDYNVDPAMATFLSIVSVVLAILLIIAMWKIFQKAGEAGWKSIIPLYNTYIMYKITWGSGWFFLLSLIPVINVFMYIITAYKLAKAFGKGFLYTLGLIIFPFIFQLILGFGNSQYRGVQ